MLLFGTHHPLALLNAEVFTIKEYIWKIQPQHFHSERHTFPQYLGQELTTTVICPSKGWPSPCFHLCGFLYVLSGIQISILKLSAQLTLGLISFSLCRKNITQEAVSFYFPILILLFDLHVLKCFLPGHWRHCATREKHTMVHHRGYKVLSLMPPSSVVMFHENLFTITMHARPFSLVLKHFFHSVAEIKASLERH